MLGYFICFTGSYTQQIFCTTQSVCFTQYTCKQVNHKIVFAEKKKLEKKDNLKVKKFILKTKQGSIVAHNYAKLSHQQIFVHFLWQRESDVFFLILHYL